jgi:hypothetical protein
MTSSGPVTAAGHTHEPEPAELAAGFKRVEAEIRSVPERELVPVNVDVLGAVTTVLGALPELRALRAQFAELRGFDLASFDKLRDYALALGHAHAMYPAAGGAAVALRQRAFTLFATTYDEVRRAVSYLRWHDGDGDDIAPSLFACRGGPGTATDPSTAPTLPDGTPVVMLGGASQASSNFVPSR